MERIQTACADAPDDAARIGIEFAQWVARTAFNFDYCDALANRLEAFFEGTEFECKVECLMALLSMGTSHNRWFVERKFTRLASPKWTKISQNASLSSFVLVAGRSVTRSTTSRNQSTSTVPIFIPRW